MTQPLVTVITITRNIITAARKEQLVECIESVYNQTRHAVIEHLVIDGASTDGTVALLESYQDKGWIRFISEPDAGIYDAMNKGIISAKGKYITFLNSDDYYHDQTAVERSLEALESSGADFSYAPVINFDEAAGTRELLVPDIANVFVMVVPNHQTIFYRRDLLIQEGMYNTTYRYVADYDFTVRMCLGGYTGVYVPDAFVTYRLGGFSKEGNIENRTFKEIVSVYYTNYRKLFPITLHDAEAIAGNIYAPHYSAVPKGLAKELRHRKPFFDYARYEASTRPLAKISSYSKHTIKDAIKALYRVLVPKKLKPFVKKAYIATKARLRRFGKKPTDVSSLLTENSMHAMKRIAVVRTDHIGDFIIFSPMLAHIKSLYPEHELVFFGNSALSEMVSWFSEIDTFVPLDMQALHDHPDAYAATLSQLSFDVVLAPVYSRSPILDTLVRRLSAPEKIGFAGDQSNISIAQQYTTDAYYTRLIESPQHILPEVTRNSLFIKELGGASRGDLIPCVEIKPSWNQSAHTLLAEQGITHTTPFVVMHMGASGPSKVWPRDRFAEVAAFLSSQGFRVVCTGSTSDRTYFEDLSRYGDISGYVDLLGKTSFADLAAILSKASLYFGSDTAAVHLAAAVGCPTVCLMGGGHFGRFFPYGNLQKNRIVYDSNMACKNDNWACAAAHPHQSAPCIAGISVHNAIAEIRNVLAL